MDDNEHYDRGVPAGNHAFQEAGEVLAQVRKK